MAVHDTMKERMDKADEARLRNYITKCYTSADFDIFEGRDPIMVLRVMESKIRLINNALDDHLSGNDDSWHYLTDRLVSEEFEKNIKER